MRPICVDCQTKMGRVRNGIPVISTRGIERTPYKVTYGDLYLCRRCGSMVIAGFGESDLNMTEGEIARTSKALH